MKKMFKSIKETFQRKRRIKQLKQEMRTLPDKVMECIREEPTDAEKIYEE